MRKLKEITLKEIALSEKPLGITEANFILHLISGLKSSANSGFDLVDNKLEYWEIKTDNESKNEYINGKLVKKTYFYANGNPAFEYWYNKEGELHREDGPAETGWADNGIKTYEGWEQNGKYYRENGPARIGWDIHGDLSFTEYYDRNGVFLGLTPP